MDGSRIDHDDIQSAVPAGLVLIRKPFGRDEISKLPKPTKKQTDEAKAPKWNGIKCQICGTWHHKDVVHLDYVGHAALTNRLLDCDPHWNWEPVAFDERGAPARDSNGGMWIRLTVCGVTRYGYGSADGKSGGDAVKEIIGDALRNAAMRFGAALNLWHKGELPPPDGPDEAPETKADEPPANPPVTGADESPPPPVSDYQMMTREIDKIERLDLAMIEPFASHFGARWDGLNDEQRELLTERMTKRRAFLAGAPGDSTQSPIDLDDSVPF